MEEREDSTIEHGLNFKLDFSELTSILRPASIPRSNNRDFDFSNVISEIEVAIGRNSIEGVKEAINLIGNAINNLVLFDTHEKKYLNREHITYLASILSGITRTLNSKDKETLCSIFEDKQCFEEVYRVINCTKLVVGSDSLTNGLENNPEYQKACVKHGMTHSSKKQTRKHSRFVGEYDDTVFLPPRAKKYGKYDFFKIRRIWKNIATEETNLSESDTKKRIEKMTQLSYECRYEPELLFHLFKKGCAHNVLQTILKNEEIISKDPKLQRNVNGLFNNKIFQDSIRNCELGGYDKLQEYLNRQMRSQSEKFDQIGNNFGQHLSHSENFYGYGRE